MKKFRETDAKRKGESATIQVMRGVIMSAVPQPSDNFQKVGVLYSINCGC